MKRLYSSHDAMMMGFLKALLQNSGIACMMRNEFLMGAAGDLPLNECWQELWVFDEADFEPAKRIIDAALANEEGNREWSCPACGETIEAQFGSCWNCGESCPTLP